MSGPQPREPANDRRDPARKAAELRAYLDGLGLPDNDPVVPLVRGLVELYEDYAALLLSSINNFKLGADADRARLNAAIAASEAQCRKVEATLGGIDIRAHDLLTRVIEGMASEVAEKLRERMVIVEHRHNRRVLWRTGALIAAVLLSTLGGGYVWRAYDDSAATDLMERCVTHPVMYQHTGQLYCQFEALKPQK